MEERKLKKRKLKALEESNQENLYFSSKELGDLYLESENYEEALQEYKESEKAAKALRNKIYIAISNRMIGETLCCLGEFEKAIAHQKLHLQLSQDEKNSIEEQRALATLGRTYFVKAESFTNPQHPERSMCLELSRNYYQKSLALCERFTNEVSQIQLSEMKSRLYLNLGLTMESQGAVILAVDYITQAINTCKRLELWENLCRSYMIQGSLYIRQRNTSAALTAIGEALKISERLDSKVSVTCELLSLKAEALIDLADYQSAKHCLIRAFKMKTPDLKDRADIERKLRIVIVMCQTETRLLETAESDMNLLKKLNETLGDCCVALKRFKKAIDYYHKMLEFSIALGETGKNLTAAYVSLSQTYKDDKDYNRSLEYSFKELALYENDPVEACKTLLGIIDTMELKQEILSKIMEQYNRGINLAESIRDVQMKCTFLKTIIGIHRDRGLCDAADKFQSELDNLQKIENTDDDALSEDVSSDEGDDPCDTIGAHIDLSDLSDFDSDKEDGETRERPVRKRVKSNFALKRNEKGETPLHVAAAKGNYNLVIKLLKQGHPINVQDAVGWLPLHEACNYGNTAVVEALLNAGADCNDRGGPGCEGITPLHDAASSGHLDVIDLLLDRGASPLCRTDKGETVLDCLKSCRERVVSESGKELDPVTLAHYNNIVCRLELALKKVGYSSSQFKQINLQKKQPKNNSANTPNLDNERIVKNKNKNFPMETKLSSSSLNTNAAEDYKETMEALRRKNKRKQTIPEAVPKKPNFPALMNSSEIGDDWLEDDIGDYDKRPCKKVCENFVGMPLRTTKAKTDKTNENFHKSVNSSNEESNSSKLNDILCEIENNENLSDSTDYGRNARSCFGIDEDVPLENEMQPPSVKEPSREVARNRMKYQKSLFSTGFKKFTPSSTSTQNEAIGQSTTEFNQRSRNEQLKEQTQPLNNLVNQKTPYTTGINCTVKVRVENKLFLVPIPDSIHNLNIGWLTSETVRRYHNVEGVTPVITLTTEDGALLDENDPLSIIINNKEIHATIASWNLAPLTDRYKEACIASHTVPDKYIEIQLDICQATCCFSIKDCRLPTKTLLPALKAISHHHNLTKLILTGINLQDETFKFVIDSIIKLPQLHLLDVSVNNITFESVTHFARTVSQHSTLQTLETLDFSFNPLSGESVSSLVKLSSYLPHLMSLSLKHIGLTASSLYAASNFHFDCIEFLDISHNHLEREGIVKLLSSLDASKIKHLNVGYTGGPEILTECILFFESRQPENLTSLNLSCLNLNDDDVCRLTEVLCTVDQISELNLSCNPYITVNSHKHISQIKSLRAVNMSGCATLTKNHELELPFCKLTLSSKENFSDYYETPYGCIINT